MLIEGCVIPALDAVGKQCPCADSLVCDSVTQSCVEPFDLAAADLPAACSHPIYFDATPPGAARSLICDLDRAAAMDDQGVGLYDANEGLRIDGMKVGGCVGADLGAPRSLNGVRLRATAASSVCGVAMCTSSCGGPTAMLFSGMTLGTYTYTATATIPPGPFSETTVPVSQSARYVVVCLAPKITTQNLSIDVFDPLCAP